jgi:hypothetical protein
VRTAVTKSGSTKLISQWEPVRIKPKISPTSGNHFADRPNPPGTKGTSGVGIVVKKLSASQKSVIETLMIYDK